MRGGANAPAAEAEQVVGASNMSGAAMTDTHCADAIRNLAAGKIAEVHVPAACSVAAAGGALEGLDRAHDAVGSLGADRVQVRWRAIDSRVAGDRLRLWHDGEHVVAVEVEAPRPDGGWDALRAALGAPDAKLPYWDDVVEVADGQWVYPARGLALFTTLDDTELARVVAFPPTTLDAYRAKLSRATEPPREFPER
ncbi:MAG TPA: hypothetical protein VHE35_12505 [Kofleriaceae bacterium]|nr:hypothetical protein [Kofleriaceae bacterium]